MFPEERSNELLIQGEQLPLARWVAQIPFGLPSGRLSGDPPQSRSAAARLHANSPTLKPEEPRIVFVKGEKKIRESIEALKGQSGTAKEVQLFSKAILEQVDGHFPKAAEMLETALSEFQAKHGGDLDVALKNEEFARLIHSKIQVT